MKRIVVVSAFLPAIGCAFFLGGCAQPLALIGQHGEILRGTYTQSPGDSSISMTNGKTTCSGSHYSKAQHDTQTFPISCSDGRTGIATLVLSSGGGRVRFSDGTEGDFIIGAGASQI